MSQTTSNAHRQASGFTLLELLIVVAIVAIAVALVVPKLRASGATKLRSAASMLVADLEYAQVESISHGTALRVLVVNSTTTYSIATAAAPTTPITNPIGKLPYSVTFGSDRAASLTGVTISSYSLGGDNKLGFGLYGQLDQAANATITLACEGMSVVITLDAITGVASVGNIQ